MFPWIFRATVLTHWTSWHNPTAARVRRARSTGMNQSNKSCQAFIPCGPRLYVTGAWRSVNVANELQIWMNSEPAWLTSRFLKRNKDPTWYYRRKFRSQTSDNMDRWKAELGRGREKRRVEESRSEKRKSQKKEDADARKGRKVVKHWKSRFTVFFQWFVVPEGRKVGSLKRRVRSHLARWEMKKCTPLWCEAHL